MVAGGRLTPIRPWARWPQKAWPIPARCRLVDVPTGLLHRLAQPNRQPVHRCPEQHSEICRVDDAGGAPAMEQLHASQGRCRGDRGQAQGTAGQGSGDPRQRRAGAVAHAKQPGRRVRAPDSPGGSGVGAPSFTEGGSFAALRLVDTKTTTTGVVIATYQPRATS